VITLYVYIYCLMSPHTTEAKNWRSTIASFAAFLYSSKMPRRKAATSSCQAKLSDGKPCPKTVQKGQMYCRWHDPDDQSWWEVYERLKKATPEERTDIVLGLIEDHPEHKLVLPERNGQRAILGKVDLSRDTLEKKRNQSQVEKPVWWSIDNSGAQLEGANFQGAFLASANFQGANLVHANFQSADLADSNFQDAILWMANFQNAVTKNVNLNGANLWKADLQGANLRQTNIQSAYLQHVNLKETNLEYANLQGTNLQYTNLQGANLQHANLQGTNLQQANLRGAYLQHADFQRATLIASNLQGANLQEAKLQDVDLSAVENISNIYVSGAWLGKNRMRREQLGDAIGEELEDDYLAAKNGYLALKQNFDDLGDYDAASWAYRKERRMEKLEALQRGKYFKFFKDIIVEWLCDYGESVWRVIGWMAALLFIVGPVLFSSLGGIVWTQDLSHQYFALSGWNRLWFWYYHYLLYTLDTLTTGSFSDLHPINDAVKLASGFFAVAGIVLAGLLGFVAGNRIRRS